MNVCELTMKGIFSIYWANVPQRPDFNDVLVTYGDVELRSGYDTDFETKLMDKTISASKIWQNWALTLSIGITIITIC